MTSDHDPRTRRLTMLVFGASGMVGRGVLVEALGDDRVGEVRAVVRKKLDIDHAKLRQVVTSDLPQDGPHLADVDVTFHSAGPSAAGLTEDAYRQQTLDLTVSIVQAVSRRSPRSTFVYLSGVGTNPHSRQMWARVKGETEQAIRTYRVQPALFRPGFIQPVNGERASNRAYRAMYAVLRPVSPWLVRTMPSLATTTQAIGRAVITAALRPTASDITTTRQINELAACER